MVRYSTFRTTTFFKFFFDFVYKNMKIFAVTKHVPWAPNTPKCVCVCLCLARFQQDLRGHVETRKERGKGEEGKEKRTEEKIRKGREKTPPPPNKFMVTALHE